MASVVQRLNQENEKVWCRVGRMAKNLNDEEKTLFSFENVLKHNLFNPVALKEIAAIYKKRGQFEKAIDYYHRAIAIEPNGKIWCDLGHCLLQVDRLDKAYSAFHQALYKAKTDPNVDYVSSIWFGLGILYDRYRFLDYAEECFRNVLKINEKFKHRSQVIFRLGMLYKVKKNYHLALQSFRFVLTDPPSPLGIGDIYCQIGHIYEVMKDFRKAYEVYSEGLKHEPDHHQLYFQIGYLHFRKDVEDFNSIEKCIDYLRKACEHCQENGQAWYVLGRVYMRKKQFKKAFDSYQQAVFRDGKNPLFWCSIGALYYSINQQQDALDAYTKAIKLNNNISEAWYNLGTLYESCSQLDDAISAYRKAAELDPMEENIKNKLLKHNIVVGSMNQAAAAAAAASQMRRDNSNILQTLLNSTGAGSEQALLPSRISIPTSQMNMLMKMRQGAGQTNPQLYLQNQSQYNFAQQSAAAQAAVVAAAKKKKNMQASQVASQAAALNNLLKQQQQQNKAMQILSLHAAKQEQAQQQAQQHAVALAQHQAQQKQAQQQAQLQQQQQQAKTNGSTQKTGQTHGQVKDKKSTDKPIDKTSIKALTTSTTPLIGMKKTTTKDQTSKTAQPPSILGKRPRPMPNLAQDKSKRPRLVHPSISNSPALLAQFRSLQNQMTAAKNNPGLLQSQFGSLNLLQNQYRLPQSLSGQTALNPMLYQQQQQQLLSQMNQNQSAQMLNLMQRQMLAQQQQQQSAQQQQHKQQQQQQQLQQQLNAMRQHSTTANFYNPYMKQGTTTNLYNTLLSAPNRLNLQASQLGMARAMQAGKVGQQKMTTHQNMALMTNMLKQQLAAKAKAAQNAKQTSVQTTTVTKSPMMPYVPKPTQYPLKKVTVPTFKLAPKTTIMKPTTTTTASVPPKVRSLPTTTTKTTPTPTPPSTTKTTATPSPATTTTATTTSPAIAATTSTDPKENKKKE